MSEENVEIIRRLYDAAEHRDSDVVYALYDPEVEVDMSRAPCRDLVGKRFYHGHDGLRAFYREWHGAWETVEGDPVALLTIPALRDGERNVMVILEAVELREGEILLRGRTQPASASMADRVIHQLPFQVTLQ